MLATRVAQVLDQVEQGATRLLGLEGLTVVRVELDGDGGRVVHAVTADDEPPACPECRVVSTSRKELVDIHPQPSMRAGPVSFLMIWCFL